jgi:hypothetical protein
VTDRLPFEILPTPVREEPLAWQVWKLEPNGSTLIAGFNHRKDAVHYVHSLTARQPGWLLSLETRVTRYKAEDGRERAVLLWEDYETLRSRG